MFKIILMRVLSCLFIFFTIVTVGLVSNPLYVNYKLISEFTQKEDVYSYGEAVEKRDLDLSVISNLFTDVVALAVFDAYKNDIICPTTISYYANINDNIPVYRIEKGEPINIKVGDKTRRGITYQGIESLPTNESRWRLAKPFTIDGKETEEPLLYVKLDELLPVAKEWIKQNDSAMSIFKRIVLEQGKIPTKNNICKYILLFMDRTLYSEGVFLSRDLLAPIFPATTFVFLFISVILLGLFLLVKHKI